MYNDGITPILKNETWVFDIEEYIFVPRKTGG